MFGHSQVGVFTAESEQSIVGLAAHAAIAIDNARLFKATQDEIAARKRIEEHQKLLLGELNHRVKNTLATVQSIASQTLRSTPNPKAFKQAFEARLIALSEAHNLLSLSEWRGVSLQELIERELAPFGNEERTRIIVEGESVSLQPAFAVALGMAIHELATNAVKYGALSTEHGAIDVTWSVDPEAGEFRLEWRESGGPRVAAPARQGFGTRLIRRSLGTDIGGQAAVEFEPAGVVCRVTAPLKAMTTGVSPGA